MLKLLSSAAVAALTLTVSLGAARAEGPLDTSKVTKDIRVSARGKTYTIATVVKVDGIAWFDRMREGVKEFKADTGQDAYEVGPSQADAAAQVEIIENLIAQGVDAICVVPFSVEAVEPVLKKARDRGIVVISHEASNIQNVDFDIEAFDNKAYGAKLMENLGKQMGGKGEYVATVGSLTSKSRNEWIDGAVEYQKQHFPEMKLATGRLETYDDANQDYNKLKEALTTYPKVTGILGAPMPTSAGGRAADRRTQPQGQGVLRRDRPRVRRGPVHRQRQHRLYPVLGSGCRRLRDGRTGGHGAAEEGRADQGRPRPGLARLHRPQGAGPQPSQPPVRLGLGGRECQQHEGL